MTTYLKKALKDEINLKNVAIFWSIGLAVFSVSILFLVILYIQASNCNVEKFDFVSDYERNTGTISIRNASEQGNTTSASVEVNVSFKDSDEMVTKTADIPISNSEGKINIIEVLKFMPEHVVKDVNVKVTGTKYEPMFLITILILLLLYSTFIVFIMVPIDLIITIKRMRA